MGRRRRNRKKSDPPAEQAELLPDAVEASSREEGEGGGEDAGEAGDEAQQSGSEPNEAAPEADEAAPGSRESVPDGGEETPESGPEAGSEEDGSEEAGAGPDQAGEPARASRGTERPTAPPAGASVFLGARWKERVAELEDIRDLEGALGVIRSERTRAPDDLELLQAEIRTLGSLGRFDAAEEPLGHLRRVADDPALVHRVAGVLLFRRGSYPGALEELRASVAEEETGETWYYVGETLNRVGRVEEALEALHRAVELDPGLGRAYSTLGRLLDRQGRSDEAAAMHRRAREAEG